MSRVRTCQLGLFFGGLFQLAQLRAPPDPSQELKLIESTEQNEDPLGLDQSTGRELDQAAARLPKALPAVSLPSANRGEGLSAIAGVHERAHQLRIELDQGLAFARVRIELASRAKHRAQLAYRLPLPADAVITRVRACAAQLCRDADPHRPNAASSPGAAPHAIGAPALSAGPIADERGRALALQAGPIAAGGALTLEIEYVAEAPIHGGRARFRVPARGYDPNLAPTQLSVSAPSLRELTPGAELTLDPWNTVELTGALPARVARELRAPCGDGACLRRFEARPPAALELRPTWLWIDASPSMEGPARGRAGAALAALLALLPGATELRAVAFAARAKEVARGRADQTPLATLADAALLELGAATHPSSARALGQAELARHKPRIVVISDGQFDASAREREALRAASRQGAELWLVALGDAEPRLSELFHGVVRASEAADRALRSEQLEPLEEQLRAIATKRAGAGVRPGEQRVYEQRPPGRWPLRAEDPWLTFWLSRERPAPRWQLGDLKPEPGVIPASPYLSTPAPEAAPDTGMPKESVLTMLRTQLVPQARACLRSDRKGRGDYAVELTFHALFAQREVFEPRIEGAVPDALRTCLTGVLAELRVPAFTGRIRVIYPIHTEREAPPPVIQLEPELAERLERVLGAPPALP